MEPALRAKALEKHFDEPARVEIIRQLDFDLHLGETVAIIGASGEGKSTLLHILGTLETANAGTLEIAGEKVCRGNRAALRNRHIGFIFQVFHLLEDYSVLDNVLMPARIARSSVSKGSEAYERAESLLNQVGLSDRMHFSSKVLSGGEKQRVSMARALMNNPSILLADEPTGNLDHKTSEIIQELLIGSVKQHGKGMLVVTHDMTLAKRCDRVLRLEAGRLSPA